MTPLQEPGRGQTQESARAEELGSDSVWEKVVGWFEAEKGCDLTSVFTRSRLLCEIQVQVSETGDWVILVRDAGGPA